MRILVGNNRLGKPGGSETYTYALIRELLGRGNDVTALTLSGGIVSNHLSMDVPVYCHKLKGSYDLILLSHLTAISLATDVIGYKVQTCHGIFPDVEQPSSWVDKHVAISEEVQSYLLDLGYKSDIIRNGIDCIRFNSFIPIEKELRTVLSLAHSDRANNVIKKACDMFGCKFISKNKYKEPVWEVEELINQADLVVGLGRGTYEAAACGRNVIIFDYRDYMGISEPIGDGFLSEINFPYCLQNNCSGRYLKKRFTAEELVQEFKKYRQEQGKQLRDFVVENLNIKKSVDQYLDLLNHV